MWLHIFLFPLLIFILTVSAFMSPFSEPHHKISLGHGNDEADITNASRRTTSNIVADQDPHQFEAKKLDSVISSEIDEDYYYDHNDDDDPEGKKPHQEAIQDIDSRESDVDDNSGVALTTGSGITIHIEDSVLNALLERVPWSDVIEGLNNKLSRTEETKHIQEHIYKTADEDNVYSQNKWDNWNHNVLQLGQHEEHHIRPPPTTTNLVSLPHQVQSRSSSLIGDGFQHQTRAYFCNRPYLTTQQWQQCNSAHSNSWQIKRPKRIYSRTWRSPSGKQEYTFRHTIIKKVQKDQPKRKTMPSFRKNLSPSSYYHHYGSRLMRDNHE